MMDNVTLIHMNGRMQTIAESQFFNAYSYVINNPLKYIDPSGYSLRGFFHKIGHFLHAALNVIKEIVIQAVIAVVSSACQGAASVCYAVLNTAVAYARKEYATVYSFSPGYSGPDWGQPAGPSPTWGSGGPSTIGGVPVLYENSPDASTATAGVAKGATPFWQDLYSAIRYIGSAIADALGIQLQGRKGAGWTR